MKKKGGLLSGLVVFVLIIIILGGVGYLGFNIITNANGMSSMSMTSNSKTTNTKSTDTKSTDTSNTDTSNETVTADNASTKDKGSTYKINQINQIVTNKDALDKAYNLIHSALGEMTLDPYAANVDTSSSMSYQMKKQSNSNEGNNTNNSSQDRTTVNIYTGNVSDQQTTQMSGMGRTYDANKMQKLHSGLYKVSVGMQLLKQLQDNISAQIEQANFDAGSETQYYINQYNTIMKDKSTLNSALTYINEAVDLININPYVDANGLVYDTDKMTTLHDSIAIIAQGVVDLNILNNNLLSQSISLGTLAQNSYNKAQLENQYAAASTMNMTSTSGINISSIFTLILIVFAVIFIIGLLGSILSLFKTGDKRNITSNPI
jgi:hypothetical protein